jgi:hypothetical protein
LAVSFRSFAKWSFAAGLIDGLDSKRQRETLQKVLNTTELRYGYVLLIRGLGVEERDLSILSQMVAEDELEPSQLESLRFAFREVKAERLARFAQSILRSRSEYGPALLSILKGYQRDHPEREKGLRPVLREILHSDLLVRLWQSRRRRTHAWQQATVRLLEDERDEELASDIAQQIVRLAREPQLSTGLGDEIRDVLEVLLSDYIEVVWPHFSSALLSGSVQSLSIIDIIARNPVASFATGGTGGPLFEETDSDFLLEWCEKQGPDAAALLVRAAPVFEAPAEDREFREKDEKESPNEPEWHPLVLELLNRFGDKEEVRESLGSNLFSFGSVGSRIPYLKRRIDLLGKLSDHEKNAVRRWSAQQITQFEAYVREEEKREEEEKLRFGA